MTPILYGIPNCDTVRRARRWLDDAGIAYQFHDLRKDGITSQHIAAWCEQADWSRLLNRSSQTFRQLDAADRTDIDEQRAQALMLAHLTLIKRPLLEHSGGLVVGFDPDAYAKLSTPDTPTSHA